MQIYVFFSVFANDWLLFWRKWRVMSFHLVIERQRKRHRRKLYRVLSVCVLSVSFPIAAVLLRIAITYCCRASQRSKPSCL